MVSMPRAYTEYVWNTRSSTRRKQLRPGFSTPLPAEQPTRGLVLLLGPVVVLDRRDGLVERDVEVVVEVGAERRVPRERPAPFLPCTRSIFAIGARETSRERGVTRVQVLEQPSDISSAPAVQLGQPSSQLGSNMKWTTMSCRRPSNRSSRLDLAVRTLEHVVLVDLDHRQLAPLGVERVARPGHRLLLGEQLLAGGSQSSRDTICRKAHARSSS